MLANDLISARNGSFSSVFVFFDFIFFSFLDEEVFFFFFDFFFISFELESKSSKFDVSESNSESKLASNFESKIDFLLFLFLPG